MIHKNQEKLTTQDIKNELDNFYGTESYHRYSPLFRYFILTDGALFLAKECEAFWLIDTIASNQIHPKLRKHEYFNEAIQCWKLTVNKDKTARLICDIDEEIILLEDIPYTDFPLNEITLLVGWSEINTELVAVCYLLQEH
jgi:hypothetical protein